MHWLSIIGIGIAANLDNLGIGVSLGARSTKIPWSSNLIIAVLSMAASYLSITAGNVMSFYIPHNWANWIGGILIILIGLWGIKTDYNHSQHHREEEKEGLASLLRDPIRADTDRNNILSSKESLALGTALALNCISGGLGAGLTGFSPWATTLSICLFSLLTIELGVRAGHQIARTWIGKYSNLIGGILLIGIGFYEIFV